MFREGTTYHLSCFFIKFRKGIGEGPGLENQDASTFLLLHKYLFLNMHWKHVKALEINVG